MGTRAPKISELERKFALIFALKMESYLKIPLNNKNLFGIFSVLNMVSEIMRLVCWQNIVVFKYIESSSESWNEWKIELRSKRFEHERKVLEKIERERR